MIEAPRHLAGQFDMGHLVLADRDLVGSVDENVGALQQRITEKTVGGEIPFPQLLLLVLVARHPFQPAERRHHGKQQMQFGMLRNMRLDEQLGITGVDAGSQPVDHHVPDALRDNVRLLVVRGERVPVGHEEEAVELMLQPDPVLENTVVVTEVQTPGGTHAREDP